MARLGSRAGPAREQARRQVEPPVADPTRARAPGARPTMALSTRVEEAANPRVPVGATPRSERIRRQAPAPWASPRSGPARLRGPEREARREQHPSSATSTAGSTRRPATPEIPTRPAQAWPAPAPPTPRFREVERPSWGRPSAAGPVSGAPRWRPRLRSGSSGPPDAPVGPTSSSCGGGGSSGRARLSAAPPAPGGSLRIHLAYGGEPPFRLVRQ